MGMYYHSRSQSEQRDQWIKVFAICAGLLALLAVLATALGLPMTGYAFHGA
jgi:type IV secretory pathway component VirB8